VHEGPFSALVSKDDDYVYAVDSDGKTIAEGEAGVDDASVIQSAWNVSGRIFIKKETYTIEAENYGDRAIGLLIPDGGVEVIAELGTVFKLTYSGSNEWVYFIMHSTEGTGTIENVRIENLILDGSLVDWYDYGTDTGTYKGSCIVFGKNARRFVNAVLRNLQIYNFINGWGIALDYVTDAVGEPHEFVTIENVRGENLGRGVVWIANTKYLKCSNVLGKDIKNAPDPIESNVVAVESGIYGEIENIRGENVQQAILHLAGSIRVSARGIKGGISDNGCAVRIHSGSHIQVSDIVAGGTTTTSGYGVHILEKDKDIADIQISNVHIEGTHRTIYVEFSGYRVKNLIIENIDLNRPVEINNVDNLSIHGGVIDTGTTDLIIDNCTNIDLDLIYSVANITNSTFRRNSGTATFSGDGSTTQFSIEHGLVSTPNKVQVTAMSSDAAGDFYVTADATYIYVNYKTAPPSGTDNVKLSWSAEA